MIGMSETRTVRLRCPVDERSKATDIFKRYAADNNMTFDPPTVSTCKGYSEMTWRCSVKKNSTSPDEVEWAVSYISA